MSSPLMSVAKVRTPETVKDGAYGVIRGYALLTSPLRPLPDYLLIGAKRSGTTAMHRWLLAHPQVRPAFPTAKNIKGVHYFDRRPWRSTRWYRSHFPLRRGDCVVGEASPYYLYHPRAAERAARVVPAAKLLVLLREPAARAWSHYRDELKNGREDRSFAEAVELEHERTAHEERRLLDDDRAVSSAFEHHTYVRQGFYAEHLRRWLQHYALTQLCVLRSEDVFADPGAAYRRVTDFLGLRPVDLATYGRENASPDPASGSDQRTYDDLRRLFQPHEHELASLLSFPIGWDR